MSSAVFSRFECSFQVAASSRQCTTDDLFELETTSEEMGPAEQLAAAKEVQRRSVLPFSASSGEGAQDSCRRAQAKSSPRALAVLFLLVLVSCCEFIATWTAATSFAGQSCSAQEDEGLLRRRANLAMAGYSELQLQLSSGKSTAQQIEAARFSDLFSAIRRVVFPDLTQMEVETPQCKRPPPSDHEISDVEQVDTETVAEQLERLMHIQGENSQLVPFRKMAPTKPKS